MNFAFFASFIVFCIWLTYQLNKSRRREAQREKIFWDREKEANNTRRKPLDDLEYITIPFDSLPMEIMTDDPAVAECQEILRSLSENPIVNLTCITNTDLKLRYGAANINLLSRYDQSYTILARTLQKWAKTLHDSGYQQEACTILEFAMATGTDVSHSYFLLSTIYQEAGTPEKIKALIPVAERLNSTLSGHIIRKLKEAYD